MTAKTHRHFVALPLAALLMLAVASVDYALPVTGANLMGTSALRFSAADAPLDFEASWMLSGTLEPQSMLSVRRHGDQAELLQGQVLVRSLGFNTLDLKHVSVHALSASYVALQDDASTTVAPLTGPVLLQTATEDIVLVPGMQVSLDTSGTAVSATVPSDWYRDRLQALKLLPESKIPSDASAQAELATLLTGTRITTDVYARMRILAETLDSSGGAQRLLLLRLLQEGSATDDGVSVQIAQEISSDSLLSMQLVTMLPPLVMTLRTPVSEPLITLWENSALSLGLTDSSAAIALLHQYAGFPRTLARAGYPKQSLLWQRALTSVGTILRTTLSGDALSGIDADLSSIARGEFPTETTPDVVADLPSVTTHWSGAELVALARNILTSRGVLMTTRTELTPDTETQTVSVTGIFIAENDVDVPYAFTVDIGRSVITNILRDGQRLPTSVPFDIFFR